MKIAKTQIQLSSSPKANVSSTYSDQESLVVSFTDAVPGCWSVSLQHVIERTVLAL